MILHILTKAPGSSAAIQMLQAIADQDSVMLVEEAVTAALDPAWGAWQQCQSRIYLLSEDLVARGLASLAADNQLPTLEIDSFVTLTEEYEKSITWY